MTSQHGLSSTVLKVVRTALRKLTARWTSVVVLAGILLSSKAMANDVDDLVWMSGCWALDRQEHGSGENWMQPAGGLMLGVSRVVSNGETVAFEYLRIVTDDGSIALIASPSGQSTTRFELVSMREHEVVFENTDHDFPQRIRYRLEGNGRLIADISGNINGVARTTSFPMTRTEYVNSIEKN